MTCNSISTKLFSDLIVNDVKKRRQDLNQYVERIMQVSRRMHQLGKVPWQVTGMPKGAFVTLCALDERACSQDREMTVSDLAKLHGISRAGVSQILRNLEDEGLVERCRRAGDRRIVCVKLTPEGLAVVRKAKAGFEDMMSHVLAQMGEDEAQQLEYLLGRFCAILAELEAKDLQAAGKAKEENCVDSSNI